MLLVHASPTTLEPYRHPSLGVFSSPSRYYRNVDGWRWAADNDAFTAWDEGRYREMLAGLRAVGGECLFVTAPDVVGDATETLRRFERWIGDLEGFPVAFVAQDGLEAEETPWDAFEALFIGGTDTFKMGEAARRLAREALERGKWLHMGRVNGHRRIRYAKAIGCDSADGSSLSRFRDTWLPTFLRHAAGPPQMLLESEGS